MLAPSNGKFVVVGGGIAGVTCAEQVRQARKQFRLPETPEALALREPLLPPFPSVFFRLLSLFPFSLPTTSVSLGIRDSVMALRGCP